VQDAEEWEVRGVEGKAQKKKTKEEKGERRVFSCASTCLGCLGARSPDGGLAAREPLPMTHVFVARRWEEGFGG
jgi:hypothetical protein